MALDFPSPASPGQIYSYGIYTWEYNGTYWKSISSISFLPISGGTVTGDTVFTSGLTATTISATTYENLPSFNFAQINGITQFSAGTNNYINFSGVNLTITSASTNTLVFSAGTGGSNTVQGITGITATDGLSGNTSSFATTIINIDKGSTQNIFKNIQVGGIFQFSAGTNNSNLNFSGIGLTITSGANNTLVFSASPGGVTSITTGYGVSADTSTGNVTIVQVFDYGKAYTTGNNLNYL